MTVGPSDARIGAPLAAPAAAAVDRPRPHRVTLLPTRWTFDVDDGESVLEAALRAGIVLPSSCRNGTCRSCRCQRAAGSVCYRVEWPGLSAEEKHDAWMLPCVAMPLSDLLVDAPRARLAIAAAAAGAELDAAASAGTGARAAIGSGTDRDAVTAARDREAAVGAIARAPAVPRRASPKAGG